MSIRFILSSLYSYVNDDYNVELHYCRSYPDQLEFGSNADGPVCFVKDGDTIREEACAIPFCRRKYFVFRWGGLRYH